VRTIIAALLFAQTVTPQCSNGSSSGSTQNF